jgi:hypothetical protein
VRKRKKGGIKSDLPKRAHEKDLRNKKKKLKEGIIIICGARPNLTY